jgi:AmiR/NasT family two-component response regulator
VIVRRLPGGWRVGSAEEPDLTSAMVLADLLAEGVEPSGRPARPDDEDEVARLRAAVAQLEHALAARIAVEQAIGVLAERQHLTPRAAFEKLRKAARSRGRKVHELARMVVASVNDPSVPLPPELAGRR